MNIARWLISMRIAIRETNAVVLTVAVLDDRIDSTTCQVWTLRWSTPAQETVELRSVVSWACV